MIPDRKTGPKMNESLIKLLVLIALCYFGLPCLAEKSANAQRSTLWERRDHRIVNLYADVKAQRPGDLLVVNIEEQSDIQNQDQRVLSKKNSSSSDAQGSYSLGGGLGSAAGNLGFDQDSAADRKFNGDAQFRSNRGYTDQFTVQVIDVLPNGNMLVSGSRRMSLEGDERQLILTGIVRSADVSMSNTVSSRLVADLSFATSPADKKGQNRSLSIKAG